MRPAWPGRVAGIGLWLWLACGVQAAEPAAALAEREQIQRERAAVEARYAQTEADCLKRFAVSGCVAQAQAQRREDLSALRLRELALDDARRKAEAEENERRLDAKRAEAQARPQPVPRAASAPLAAAAASASAASAAAPSDRARRRSKTADDAAEAAARVAAQQRRAMEAAAHRQEVEQRNAERAARGKNSTPLPVPTAASVAATASEPAR